MAAKTKKATFRRAVAEKGSSRYGNAEVRVQFTWDEDGTRRHVAEMHRIAADFLDAELGPWNIEVDTAAEYRARGILAAQIRFEPWGGDDATAERILAMVRRVLARRGYPEGR